MPFDPGIPGAITLVLILLVFGALGALLEARRQRRREREAHEDAMEEWRRDHLVGERLDFLGALTYSRGEV